ncbi:MAG TPA: hypothetical protein VK966_05175 [Longimicrobiales bacterium]|nr:hypothetical protein [Longimicrobiales bacterium]
MMETHRRIPAVLLALAALVSLHGCDDLTLPNQPPGILGGWLVADGGEVWGIDTGNMTFYRDGSVVLDGYILTDGGYETYEVSGTWEERPGSFTLRLGGEQSSWDVVLDDEEAIFHELDGDRAFRLIRPGPD